MKETANSASRAYIRCTNSMLQSEDLKWINWNAQSAATYTTQKMETQNTTYNQEPLLSNYLKTGLAQFAERRKASL